MLGDPAATDQQECTFIAQENVPLKRPLDGETTELKHLWSLQHLVLCQHKQFNKNFFPLYTASFEKLFMFKVKIKEPDIFGTESTPNSAIYT